MAPRIDPTGCLSVVMPCRDGTGSVAALLARVLASPFVGEVIAVDDAPRDASLQRVRGVADPRLRLLHPPRAFGRGAALRCGFAQARLPLVVIQDPDADYGPDAYAALLEPIVEGSADAVFGARDSLRLADRILTGACNLASGLALADAGSGCKAFRREVLEAIDVEEDGFGFELEFAAKLAARGWRIREIAVPRAGRAQDPGDGMRPAEFARALCSSLRYGHRLRAPPPPPPHPAGFASADETLAPLLENLDGAANYTRWIVDLIAPHLGPTILEVGAGYGTFSKALAAHGRLVVCDPSPRCVERLRRGLAGLDVEVLEGDASGAALAGRSFDSVVLINVLEHIERDVDALRALAGLLTPQGRCIAFAPALPRLYSDVDRAVGHFRRYLRGELMTRFHRAGLEVVDARYVNVVGATAWWLGTKVLGISPGQPWGVRAFDRIAVPLTRSLEARFAPRCGQSLLVVGRNAPAGGSGPLRPA